LHCFIALAICACTLLRSAIVKKSARKMLVKLLPCVKFINVLQEAFAKKIQSQNVILEKAAQNTFIQKMRL